MNFARLIALAALALVALLAACSSAPSSSPPSGASPVPTTTPAPTDQSQSPPTPTPTQGAATEVTSPAQAAALVFDANPQFAGIGPLQRDLIGQSAWYQATETQDGFSVIVTVGSGDCQAGCINRRTWTYSVARDGTVELVSEEGDEVDWPVPQGGSGPATIVVHLIAGPICPVVQEPPRHDCEPRSLANAEAVLRDPGGNEIGRAVADNAGRIDFSVAGGAYYVEPQAAEGMPRPPAAAAVSVLPGGTGGLVFTYDTGIR